MGMLFPHRGFLRCDCDFPIPTLIFPAFLFRYSQRKVKIAIRRSSRYSVLCGGYVFVTSIRGGNARGKVSKSVIDCLRAVPV